MERRFSRRPNGQNRPTTRYGRSGLQRSSSTAGYPSSRRTGQNRYSRESDNLNEERLPARRSKKNNSVIWIIVGGAALLIFIIVIIVVSSKGKQPTKTKDNKTTPTVTPTDKDKDKNNKGNTTQDW